MYAIYMLKADLIRFADGKCMIYDTLYVHSTLQQSCRPSTKDQYESSNITIQNFD